MADVKISAMTGIAGGTLASGDKVAVADASDLAVAYSATIANIKTYCTVPDAPSVISVGAEFTSTGVPTATLPGTHAADDILILVLQSSNDSQVTAPAGYANLGPQNGFGAAATALSSKLSIFWKRDGGSESAPTIPDTGNHTYGMMFAVRGCLTVGDPFTLQDQNWKFTASTSGTSPVSVTTVDNTLVVDIFAGNVSNAGAEGSSLANTDLASVTEQFDDGTTDGTGGFIYVASGVDATAGEVKATTVTWANSSSDLCTRIHFIPAGATRSQMAVGREAEIQKFIGSIADLDDTWVKPYGARRVFVQLIDGGGSGSNGRNAATAAGGGGGGGGGYDEMWFNASDLTATVSVHAGKGGAAITTNVDGTAGNVGVVSQFGKGVTPPYMPIHITGTAAVGAISADGGNGGCGSGRGFVSPAVATTRVDIGGTAAAGAAHGAVGGRGGSGTTTPTGGSPAEWGGGGGESGADTDAGLAVNTSGDSFRGGGGGAGGRSNTNVSVAGAGGGAVATAATANLKGNDSTRFPYGGSGGNAGTSSTGTGGAGGFPGGGGGGGGTASGTQNGGAGAHGAIQVTTYF